MYEVEAYPGEHEMTLMAEHFELQVSHVDKFQKPRPPPCGQLPGGETIPEIQRPQKRGGGGMGHRFSWRNISDYIIRFQ